jgi:glycosyltransferase involved in cell wall biosynthesis
MQEIKKRRIVLASVLKPVTEPRMFDKIGVSLSKNFEVYCIGAPNPSNKSDKSLINPKIIELPKVSRISLSRILIPFNVLLHVIKIKPSVVIICTQELICISFFAKILTGCKVLYDVQENYYRNIRYGNSFPGLLRSFIASYVRFKEMTSRLFTSHYFLAEKGYEQEMMFFGKNRTVLENKVIHKPAVTVSKKSINDGCIHLVFTGTLAQTTGVFIAIDLAIKLHELNDRIRLLIIGYSSTTETVDLIQSKIQHHSYIELKGGKSVVPHEDILCAIQSADFGIISYPANPSTINSIPTKLFEYLAFRLPILLIENVKWQNICDPYNAAISFNHDTFSAADLLTALKSRKFYTNLPQDVFWLSEEKKLLQTMETLFPQVPSRTHTHTNP